MPKYTKRTKLEESFGCKLADTMVKRLVACTSVYRESEQDGCERCFQKVNY